VNSSAAVGGVKVSADGHGVVSHAGVGLLREVADLSGLSSQATVALADMYQGPWIHAPGDVFADLAAAVEAVSGRGCHHHRRPPRYQGERGSDLEKDIRVSSATGVFGPPQHRYRGSAGGAAATKGMADSSGPHNTTDGIRVVPERTRGRVYASSGSSADSC
jgi:hypothetical protein